MSKSYYDYNDYSPEHLSEFVNRTLRALEAVKDEFDSIAVRGVSGLMVGSPVGLIMDKPIVVVRKPGEQSHAYGLVSGARLIGKRYVIVDDFVSSGATMRTIMRIISGEFPLRPEFMGLYQYMYDEWKEAAFAVPGDTP